jgi:hypothetical protein
MEASLDIEETFEPPETLSRGLSSSEPIVRLIVSSLERLTTIPQVVLVGPEDTIKTSPTNAVRKP